MGSAKGQYSLVAMKCSYNIFTVIYDISTVCLLIMFLTYMVVVTINQISNQLHKCYYYSVGLQVMGQSDKAIYYNEHDPKGFATSPTHILFFVFGTLSW